MGWRRGCRWGPRSWWFWGRVKKPYSAEDGWTVGSHTCHMGPFSLSPSFWLLHVSAALVILGDFSAMPDVFAYFFLPFHTLHDFLALRKYCFRDDCALDTDVAILTGKLLAVPPEVRKSVEDHITTRATTSSITEGDPVNAFPASWFEVGPTPICINLARPPSRLSSPLVLSCFAISSPYPGVPLSSSPLLPSEFDHLMLDLNCSMSDRGSSLVVVPKSSSSLNTRGPLDFELRSSDSRSPQLLEPVPCSNLDHSMSDPESLLAPVLEFCSLGARGGFLGWYITSPSQGHRQSTWQKPTWYIASSFRMFPASFPAVSLGQEMVSTFTMSQVM